MAWVEISDAQGVSYTLTSSGGVVMDGALIFPDGADARLHGWSLAVAPDVRIGVRYTSDAYPAAQPGQGWGGGLFAGRNGGGSPIIGFNQTDDGVVLGDGVSADIVEVGVGLDGIAYEPAFSGEETLPIHYNITVYVSDEPGPDATSYNCACDDDYPRTTLAHMRNRIATRLGFATQVSMGILPPGMAPLLDDFIRNAQEMLYRRYSVFRMERFYTWNMEPGVRFYDFDANADACPKRMDPRMVTWVGISQGDLSWRPLVCGIDPVMYGSPGPGIPSHYEIRQCIEVWPPPVDSTWKLRIKGNFGLLPLEADSDETTIDPEAIFLQALANAKAHYSQPDAGNYAAQATAYVRSLVAGSHHTRRYIPGSAMPPPAVRPVMKED